MLVPKVGRPVQMNDYRPVALASHTMKTLERLLLRHLQNGCGIPQLLLKNSINFITHFIPEISTGQSKIE